MFKRNIKSMLAKALLRSPVVLLNGARQVGKSTLVREFLNEQHFNYVTFDDEMVYLAAKSDPIGFIANIEKPLIIDEVQRVPEVFLAIKMDVDKERVPGKFLITGSANPLLIPKLGDSLAGRMEIVDLMPLSQGEILGVEEKFIDTIFSQSLAITVMPLKKEELYAKIIAGGYPSVQGGDDESREAWMRSYLNLILQRDIKDLAQIEKITELPNLLKTVAHRVSGLLNVSEVARDCKMVAQTVHRYLALLETIFLISLQPAWHSNSALRSVKSPKMYLVDSGLLTYLLGIDYARALNDSNVMGKILENFVVNELKKQITWSSVRPQMYHFRAVSGEEVDVVLERRSGELVGIEIKASEHVEPKDFKGLRCLQEKSQGKFVCGIVLYAGAQTIPFGKNMFAVPVAALWSW